MAAHGILIAITVTFCFLHVINCDPNDPEQKKLLFDAIKGGDKIRVKELLLKGISPNIKDDIGNTPILYATTTTSLLFDNIDVIHDLLKAGADMNVADSHGWTPLHFACKNGDVELVKVLVDSGADVLRVTNSHETPLAIAEAHHNDDIVSLIHNFEDQQHMHRHKELDPETYIPHTSVEKLFHYTQTEDLELMKTIIKSSGVDPNIEDAQGWTALTVAADEGLVHSLRTLVELGADINKAERDGWTPLMFAASKGQYLITHTLLELGADPALHTVHGNYAHEIAFASGHDTVGKLLIERGLVRSIKLGEVEHVLLYIKAGAVVHREEGHPIYEDAKVEDHHAYELALLNATLHGEYETVRGLISIGVDPHLKDETGWTGITHAAAHGHIDIVKLFIEAGLDINHPENDGWTPLMFATNSGDRDMVDLLLKHGADPVHLSAHGISAFSIAMAANNTEILHAMNTSLSEKARYEEDLHEMHEADFGDHSYGAGHSYAYGSDAGYASPDGHGLLHAAHAGDSSYVRQLLDEGADPEVVDSLGWRPITFAAAAGNVPVITELVLSGATVNVAENDGWTPLHFAAATGSEEAIIALLEAGADLFAQNKDGHKAFEVAANNNHMLAAQALLNFGLREGISKHNISHIVEMVQSGADPDDSSVGGVTGLIIAANQGNTTALFSLIDYGADPNRAEDDGWTPLCFAAFNGHMDMVRELINIGAECKHRTNAGMSASEYAEHNSHHDVAKVIDACVVQESLHSKRHKDAHQRLDEMHHHVDEETREREKRLEYQKLLEKEQVQRSTQQRTEALAQYASSAKERARKEEESRKKSSGKKGWMNWLW